MLKLHHVCGKTYAIETDSSFLPVYQLNERKIVLLDTGIAADRGALMEFLQAQHWQVQGIICSHGHMDHSGNIRFLRGAFGCRVAAHEIEAAIASTSESFLAHYRVSTPDENGGVEESFSATDIITPQTRQFLFCGAEFYILQLPGHSGGHIGVITPDHVAYLGDGLMGLDQLAVSKMPTTQHLRRDLKSKRSLHDLKAAAYIVAHKDITTDIHPLIDANIRCYEEKAQGILTALHGTMTCSQWLQAYCEAQGLQMRSEDTRFVFAYGFQSMVDYLEELGKVQSLRRGDDVVYEQTRTT